jgi:isoquinoline 1-oxidoreductase beta subunit
MAKIGTIARRTFLFGAAALAGGAAFGYYRYRSPYENPLITDLERGEASLNAYLKIATDNRITIIVPRAEMGQGVSTTLAALVAEELDVLLEQVTVEHGPTAPVYFNRAALAEGAPVPRFDEGFTAEGVRGAMGVVAKFLGLQFTGGSSSTIDAFDPMRLAGAMAREMLKIAAADRLGVKPDQLETKSGQVVDPGSARSLSYGELALDATRVELPDLPALRPASEWTILGKPQMRTDMHAKATGAPIFGIDVDLPDLLFATVRMSPFPGAGIKAFDATAAAKMRGVVKIVRVDSPFGKGFGVIADNTWRAFQAADAVSVEWEKPEQALTSGAVFATLEQALATGSPFRLRTIGDPDAILAETPADRVLEATYRLPYLAHAPMEPMNATALVKDGRLTVWAPTQAPGVVQMVAERITRFDPAQIDIRTTSLGGGFGRRLETDYCDYAIRLAMEAEGRPVKVTWSREEDMTHGMYRPAAVGRYRGVLGGDGMPVAVAGALASQSVITDMVSRIAPLLPVAGPDNTMLDGAYNQPYAFENHRVDARKVALPVPVGSWRSVGYSINAVMQECFLDELAEKGGLDPVELRRRLLKDSPAALGVVEKVAAMAGWGSPLPRDRARGFAYTLSFGTHVAEVVEVAQTEGGIRVAQVWCVADPGRVLDPRIFEAQMMSGIIFGLSAATQQEITLSDGAVEQQNFSDYPLLRMDQAPRIETALLEQSPFMGGAGEPATPPVMPALMNAVSALTGRRIRELPLMRSVEFA